MDPSLILGKELIWGVHYSQQPINQQTKTREHLGAFVNMSGLISPVFLMVLTKIKQLILRCSCLIKLSCPWEERTLEPASSAHTYIPMAFPGKLQLSNTWSRKNKTKQSRKALQAKVFSIYTPFILTTLSFYFTCMKELYVCVLIQCVLAGAYSCSGQLLKSSVFLNCYSCYSPFCTSFWDFKITISKLEHISLSFFPPDPSIYLEF